MKTACLAVLVALPIGCGADRGSSTGADDAGHSDSSFVRPVPDAHGAFDVGVDDVGAGDTSVSRDEEGPPDAGGDHDASHDAGAPDGSAFSTHEPPGMSAQIDTGPITSPPPAGFTMFSPLVMTSTGESSSNLVRVPDGSGLRLLYNPTLEGGNSPVRFGRGIGSPGKTTYYQRWRVRTVENWAGPRNGNGVKLCEPRELNELGADAGPLTNHILMMWPNGGEDDQMSAMEGLQGPGPGQARDLGVNQGLLGNMTDGMWHWDERVYVAESEPGAGDGQYSAYLDGALVARYADVQWLGAGDTWGIGYWMVDPTFGGAPSTTHPLAGDFWDFDQLYVSTK
jgi:hypothetical protein